MPFCNIKTARNMTNWNWKDLLANRERKGFPEVVVPLARDSAPTSKEVLSDDASHSLDRASSQEKGISAPRTESTLTLEALRAEIESDIAASGHDSVYDRMFQ